MIGTFLFCAAVLAQSPSPSPPQRGPAGAIGAHARDEASALIERALSCEARGLNSDRLKYLARAILIDPTNVTARGLMGLVPYGRRWVSPEEVSKQAQADEALNAKLAQYEARREELLSRVERLLDKKAIEAALDRHRDTFEIYVAERRAEERWRHEKAARAHMDLALWCEQNGLKPEATAHFAQASQIDPGLRTPWEHLGCKRHKGRWMTEEQIIAEQREVEARRHADRHWQPLLRKLKAWLDQSPRRREAEQRLAQVADPRAVPSIWRVFARGGPRDRRRSVALLARVDSPESTSALALLAVGDEVQDVREAATDSLLSRDPRDVISDLVDRLQSPLHYKIEPPRGYLEEVLYHSRGILVVEGDTFLVKRSYRNRSASTLPSSPQDVVAGRIADGMLTQRLSADIREIEQHNEATERLNLRILAVLGRVTGQSLGDDPNAWRKWWADQRGYVYEPLKADDKRFGFSNAEVSVGLPVPPHTACFGAGTPVRTFSGLRPIESIKVGDRVLAQDTRTGALSYEPVLATHRNGPNPCLRIAAGGEAIVATGIHRFWEPGRGWVMARDLKPGDLVRIVGGTVKIDAVRPDSVQPVYNLDVARDRTFFVGRTGMLVHDFSPVEAVTDPFDSVGRHGEPGMPQTKSAKRTPAESGNGRRS